MTSVKLRPLDSLSNNLNKGKLDEFKKKRAVLSTVTKFIIKAECKFVSNLDSHTINSLQEH